MRIFLQTHPVAGQINELPKYVQLTLQQDLFGGWTLIRETGFVGGKPASLKREQYPDHTAAQHAIMVVRDQHLKKGFRVMFAEGEERPSFASIPGPIGASDEL